MGDFTKREHAIERYHRVASLNDFWNRYYNRTKKRCSFFLSKQSPYGTKEGEFVVRKAYIEECLQRAMRIWKACEFETWIVVYEDKYNEGVEREVLLLESCFTFRAKYSFLFQWEEEGEWYTGKRYLWDAAVLEVERLFLRILLSDLGENTALDGSVYLWDCVRDMVFFLYDDRGIDIYAGKKEMLENIVKHKEIQPFLEEE